MICGHRYVCSIFTLLVWVGASVWCCCSSSAIAAQPQEKKALHSCCAKKADARESKQPCPDHKAGCPILQIRANFMAQKYVAPSISPFLSQLTIAELPSLVAESASASIVRDDADLMPPSTTLLEQHCALIC
jgi:hypothetical protein